ncbi:conserved Plasmodium protein, unknown function [Plasmodium ovale wallikeri]|uniref:Uncharacterized protein n=1 Tax=Plasmodium ovale wallikeri TaxID=864142 RepID=A0A1A8YX40_PLAOA|nr:conserved Plasmodium protein, unknown function [Plasmodium ovale wallikeri]SBT36688.1 conserved Plasmodium protein, unknown function [Plasmodium ovale wallikeri]
MQYIKRKTIANFKYDDHSREKSDAGKKNIYSFRKSLRSLELERTSTCGLSNKEKKSSENIIKLKSSYRKETPNCMDKNSLNKINSKKGNVPGRDFETKHDTSAENKRRGSTSTGNSFYISKSSMSEVEPKGKVTRGKGQEVEMEGDTEESQGYAEVREEDAKDSDEDVEVSEEHAKESDEDTEVSEEDMAVSVTNDDYSERLGVFQRKNAHEGRKKDIMGGRKKNIPINSRQSVFERLATTNQLGHSNKCANEKLRKQFTENISSIMKQKPRKSFSIRLDKNVTYSSFMPYNKARKENMEKKLNIIRAKSQMLKIAERYMSSEKIKSLKMKERSHTQSLAKNKKWHLDMGLISGPFIPKRREELKGLRRPGYIPNYLREINMKIKSNQTNEIRGKTHALSSMGNVELGDPPNDRQGRRQCDHLMKQKTKRLVLRKRSSVAGFPLFENIIALNYTGGVYTWDGYRWKCVHNSCESFTSICTNKWGQVICINSKFKPGYMLNDKCFERIETWGEGFFVKIIISQKNKMWGINLRGDLQKWDTYEWTEVRKAYGIAKLKSLAFDRNNQLWLLDQRNYFYIYDGENKNWMLKNVNGVNIKDFDFNENNVLVAVANDGVIKIYKNNRWIKYGILAEMKIACLHFLRAAQSGGAK